MALLTAVGFISGFMAATAVLTVQKEIPTGANIVTDINLSVYENGTTTTELTFIDWGTLLPTQSETFSMWIQNDATIDMLIFISTQNWVPEYANETITLSYAESMNWGAGQYPVLRGGQKASVILTLTAGENPPTGVFSFTIVVTATST